MIIAGAGGHALEVLDSLSSLEGNISPLFFSEFEEGNARLTSEYRLIYTREDLVKLFKKDADFFLGVGNPELRKRFLDLFENLGGKYKPLRDKTSVVSPSSSGEFDAMAFTYIGPEVNLGKGVLVNTRANVHHNCNVGEFSEIGPGSLLLGNVQVGKNCRIGAGSIILPRVKLGDFVVVGAGAVVTLDIPDHEVIAGVPARSIKK